MPTNHSHWLEDVVAEVIEKLVTGDWTGMSNSEDEAFYYIVGADAHDREVQQLTSFDQTEIAGPAPVEDPEAEAYIRAQLAGVLPDHIARVKARVVAHGVRGGPATTN